MLPHKMFYFRVSEMPFPVFSAGHFLQKYVQVFILFISSVVGNKVRCLREKRPVTPSESDDYGTILKIKEILTQEHQYMAKNVKNISVIPRFSRLRVQKKKKRDNSQSKP